MTVSSASAVIVILGPTASGKSWIAQVIARKFNGVIINADSMQIYRNFPVLSATPAPVEMKTIPHKLYGVFDLLKDEQCSAANWRKLALQEIEDAQRRGQLPILVGGTGFYIKALMEGLSDIPNVPKSLRVFLSEALHDYENRLKLYHHLEREDPESVAKIPLGDTQRLVRALEVLFYTKKSLSVWKKDSNPLPQTERYRFFTIALQPSRDILYQRINHRVVEMLQSGAIEEVNEWMKASKNLKPVPLIGHEEIATYLRGQISYEEALAKMQQKTRNYAKRQITWLRNQIVPDLVINQPLGN